MDLPNCIYMLAPGLDAKQCRRLAKVATKLARQSAPKLTGAMARGIEPYWDEGRFGLQWAEEYTYFQSEGIKAFTMRSLAGKVIPMWLDDPDGRIYRENPKAKRRVRHGRHQTLIFRKAAPIGSTKTVKKFDKRGHIKGVSVVPRSYPGAPGRVRQNYRHSNPIVPSGRVAGQIMAGNVGVRWRHPGMGKKWFLREAVEHTAHLHHLRMRPLHFVRI
jgi:hypothetical protein